MFKIHTKNTVPKNENITAITLLDMCVEDGIDLALGYQNEFIEQYYGKYKYIAKLYIALLESLNGNDEKTLDMLTEIIDKTRDKKIKRMCNQAIGCIKPKV